MKPAILAILAAALLAMPPPVAAAATLSDSLVPAGGFAVHGDSLVWLRVSPDGVDLMQTDLLRLRTTTLDRVEVSSDGFKVDGLRYDGNWSVWSQSAGDNFDLFAYDHNRHSVRQLTKTFEDETEFDLDAGRVVFARGGHLWLLDLANSSAAPQFLSTGAGTEGAREPALHGDQVAWVGVNATHRGILRGTLQDGQLQDVQRVDLGVVAYDYAPLFVGDSVAWTTTHAEHGQTWQTIELAGGNASARTVAEAPRFDAIATDGERVVWSNAALGDALWSSSPAGDLALNLTARQVSVSATQLVAWSGTGALGRLVSLNSAAPRNGLPAVGPMPLLVVLLALCQSARSGRRD